MDERRLPAGREVVARRFDQNRGSSRQRFFRARVWPATIAVGVFCTIFAASPSAFGASTSTSSSTSSSTSTSSTPSTGANGATSTTTTATTTTSVPTTSPSRVAGYWVVRSNGSVVNFGVPSFGDLSRTELSQPIVAAAATPDGHGYWLVTSGGGVYAFGDAQFEGSPGGPRCSSQWLAWPLHPMASVIGWLPPTEASMPSAMRSPKALQSGRH